MTATSASVTAALAVIYLNDSRDSYLGFDRTTARLRLAARFLIPAPESAAAVAAALEDIFVQLNVGGDLVPAADYTLEYRAAGHRSVSVGDVLVIGECAFTVARFGFDRLPASDLSSATAQQQAS